MGKHDDSIFEVAEFLRKETLACKSIDPRYYEGWEITITSHEYRVTMPGEEGRWKLQARRRNRKVPTANDCKWLDELVKLVSEGKTLGYEIRGNVHCYWWEHDEIKLDEEEESE